MVLVDVVLGQHLRSSSTHTKKEKMEIEAVLVVMQTVSNLLEKA